MAHDNRNYFNRIACLYKKKHLWMKKTPEYMDFIRIFKLVLIRFITFQYDSVWRVSRLPSEIPGSQASRFNDQNSEWIGWNKNYSGKWFNSFKKRTIVVSNSLQNKLILIRIKSIFIYQWIKMSKDIFSFEFVNAIDSYKCN